MLVLSYVNSTITLIDQNGPGGAQFQRNPSLDQPLVPDASAPGQCNPALSVDPATCIPQCAIGYIFNNGFGGKMPGVDFLGTNAAYGGQGFAVDPSYMPWGHTNPTYAARDDVGKAIGRHTIQFGAQYVYSQRNQTNNAIGAASGDLQGLVDITAILRIARETPSPISWLNRRLMGRALRRIYSKLYPGFRATPLLPALSDRGTLFQDDWKVDQPAHLESRLASQPVWHLQRKEPECVELGSFAIQSDAICGGSRCTANSWIRAPG